MRRPFPLIYWLLLFATSAFAPAFAEEAPSPEALVEEGERLFESLGRAGRRRTATQQEALEAAGTRRQVLDEQAWQAQLAVQRILKVLAENVAAQQEAGLDVAALREDVQQRFDNGFPPFRDQLDARLDRMTEIRRTTDAATGGERQLLEERISEEARHLISSFAVLTEITLALEPIGVDVSAARTYLHGRQVFWADYVAASLRVALRERVGARARLAVNPGDGELKSQALAVENWIDRNTTALADLSKLMERLGLETSEHRQLLFEATGEITTDVLDRDVALGLLGRWRRALGEGLASEGPRWLVRAAVFLLILVAFRLLAALVRRVMRSSVSSTRLQISQLLRDSLISWSSRIVMAIGVLVALSQLGIEIGPLLAGLGIAGFVIGFAMQDSLSNFAAGAMILVYRPFDVGDLIEAAGVRGTVSNMTLVSTTILTLDNCTLIVPNNKLWGDVIQNVTAQRIRRVDLVFGISYGADVLHAETVLRDILANDERVLEQPESLVAVDALGDSSVNFVVRPWVETQDYWDVYRGITREVKLRFDKEGLSIPFPQRDVHLHVAKDA